MEIWKDIAGYEGLYQVSNFGRVKSIDRVVLQKDAHGGYAKFHYKSKILELPINSEGYNQLKLDGKIIRVHRAVAQAFIPNPANKPFINHKDGNKLNNRVENLEWCTNQENQIHASKILGHKQGRHLDRKVRCVETDEIFENSMIAANGIRHKANNIRAVANHYYGRNTCGGYHWEFVD